MARRLCQRPRRVSRKELEPSDICAVVDRKEQAPLDLLIPFIEATLVTGDYSVRGLEDLVCIERKSLSDLVACCGRERERFDRCIQRMRSYETSVLVIESSWGAIHLGQWRGQIKPSHVKGSLYSWMRHVSVVIAGDRTNAAAIVSGILFSAARQNFRQLQAFYDELKIDTSSKGKIKETKAL